MPRFLTADAGVRDRLPMCRVEGSGKEDLEPMTSTSVLEELSLRKLLCIQVCRSDRQLAKLLEGESMG